MIFFFWGPNSFAARQKIREMIEAYVKKAGDDIGLERINGGEVDDQTLRSSLTSAPFLASTRLVIVENLGQNKKAFEEGIKLLDQIPDTTVAVFLEEEADQRTGFFKQLSKKAQTVKFDNLGAPKLESWAKQQFDKLGSIAEPAAVKKLVEITGDDQWRLNNEIQKLANFGEAIGLKEVEELVTESPTQTIFELVDAMSAGKLKEALSMYHGLLEQQINEHYVLTMIIWQLRNLLLAKAAGSIGSGELAKKAGLSPFVADKAMAKRDKFSEETIKKAFLLALETDYEIKSGVGESEPLVERLIYRVSQELTH